MPGQAVKIVHRKGARLKEVIEGTVANVSGGEVQVAGCMLHRVREEATQSDCPMAKHATTRDRHRSQYQRESTGKSS